MIEKLREKLVLFAISSLNKNKDFSKNLQLIEGEVLAFSFKGSSQLFYFKIEKGGLSRVFDAKPRVIFSGSGLRFLLLYLGFLDFDPLFFQRKISVSGSLSTVLILKNAFDYYLR